MKAKQAAKIAPARQSLTTMLKPSSDVLSSLGTVFSISEAIFSVTAVSFAASTPASTHSSSKDTFDPAVPSKPKSRNASVSQSSSLLAS